MKSSTGRWVSGDDFFDRERELALLESRVRDGNHMAMTGQRRMGKTNCFALPQGHRPQVPETGREGGPDHRASVCRPIRDAHDDLRTIR